MLILKGVAFQEVSRITGTRHAGGRLRNFSLGC
jgi:hypothetical protein